MNRETCNDKQKNPLISIVIPVYNTEKYLRQCLNSVCRQSYKNMDVVLVDDGSTDESSLICQEYCETDPRFRLFSQNNAGLGAARNRGKAEAEGEYICFVDSDDRIHPDYIRILYENLISQQADLSICSFHVIKEKAPESKFESLEIPQNKIQVMDRVALLGTLLSEDDNVILVAWNKLVSRDWLNGFQFENKWHEDQFMINEYIRRCNKAVLTSAALYDYRERPNSIMGTSKERDLRHLDDLEAKEQRIRYFYKEEYRALWKPMFLQFLNNKASWYSRLADKENAAQLRKIIYPRYVWGVRQYIKMGGLFRKKGGGARICLFLISPKLYQKQWEKRHSKKSDQTVRLS